MRSVNSYLAARGSNPGRLPLPASEVSLLGPASLAGGKKKKKTKIHARVLQVSLLGRDGIGQHGLAWVNRHG